jgi:signal transduction histidine kinase
VNIPSDQLKVDALALNKVLDFLPYPFLVSESRNGVFHNLYVNRKFAEEIGYTIPEIPTIHHWFMKAYPDKAYRNEVVTGWRERTENAQESGDDSVMMNALIQTKAMGQKWYEVKSSVFSKINLVAFININDVILKERELERLNENKNRTLSILSHDLRSPLMNLHTLCSLALSSDLSREQFIDTVSHVNQKTFQVLEFVETTLLWTKSNFDSVNITLDHIYMSEVARNILELYGSSIKAKSIEVNVEIGKDDKVVSDHEIVTIVLRNLLSNAIKFTPDGGRITVCHHKNAESHVITVEDSGIGMSADMIETILVENYSSRQGTRQEKGLGIGLRLCRELLKKLKGKLEISSEPGKGTSVRIVLDLSHHQDKVPIGNF